MIKVCERCEKTDGDVIREHNIMTLQLMTNEVATTHVT